MKRIISAVLVLCILFGISTINVLAAYDDSFSVTYGGKTLPLSQYNPNNGAVYFTDDGGPCPKHVSGSCRNCKDYNGASQCLGFAFYVQDSLFGFHYRKYDGLNAEKFNIITNFTPNENDKVGCTKALLSNVTLGAHIRTKKGHSMIVATQNNDYIWTYEGNSDYRCGVHFRKRTWLEMYEYLSDRGVSYIASPKSEYYNKGSNSSSNNVVKKKCSHSSYNSYGKCKSCGAEYSMKISSISSTTYQAVKNDVPVRNRPYSPEKITKYLSKGAKVTVVASGKNSAGNLWYKLSDGSWIYSKNLEKVKEVVPEASTLKINVTQYPTTIDQGASFGLRGEINSNYNVTSVKGYIINSSGSTVMSTSDTPNSKSNNIRYLNLNEDMMFGDLSSGTYTLRIVAKDSSGDDYTTWEKVFTVKAKNSVSSDNISADNSNYGQTVSNGVYVIATKLDNNFVLDIADGSTEDGANLQLWEANGTPAQEFEVKSVANGYYQIINVKSGKALDVQNGSTDAGTNVWQYQVNNTDAQLWKIVSAGGGSYYIIGKGSGLYLDVDNAYADSGTNVKIFDRNDAYDAQKWVFTKVSSGSSSSSASKPNDSTPTTPSTSIRFELDSVPKGNLQYGKSFSLKGWFRSDSPIVEARAYILDSGKNVVMQSEKASSTTSNYKIQGYKLDKAMKFGELSPGGYYLKYYVKDANGDTATWVSDMFYIVK